MKINYKEKREGLIKLLSFQGIYDKNVLDAMLKVPREEFVLSTTKHLAYENVALPIEKDQTISQPFTVALMLEALDIEEGDKILEVGTGSGYNASLLSILVGKKGEVITTDIIKELTDEAEIKLEKLKCENVKVLNIDASQGYKEEAPYDKIIITAAIPEINNELIDQLKIGGIIIAPVGRYEQEMIKIRKTEQSLIQQSLGYFYFVPLKGKKGFQTNHL